MTARMVRPYGDGADDGTVQISFTLPVPDSVGGEQAAVALAGRMGLVDIVVAHSRALDDGFTFYVVYGSYVGAVTYEAELDRAHAVPAMSVAEIDATIERAIGRPLVVVGACIGSDAHTVGIDAIINIKGFGGEKGLEYYHWLRLVNLGAQVSVEALLERAAHEHADVLLISQVVTQNDAHIHNIHALTAALAGRDGEWAPLVVVGGPRLSAAMAADLGVDRAFGRGTSPRQVAQYLADVADASPHRFAARETTTHPAVGTA